MSLPARFETRWDLLWLERLDCRDAPPVLAVGFRFTDDGAEKWTQRFNQFKAKGVPAVEAGSRTLAAGLSRVKLVPARTVLVGAVSSRDAVLAEDAPVRYLGSAVSQALSWEWRPDLLSKEVHRSLHRLGNAAARDAEVQNRYNSAHIDGPAGRFIIVDDFCTRGATFAEVARALLVANPEWRCSLGIALAKTERRQYWGHDQISNDHVPERLEEAWLGG